MFDAETFTKDLIPEALGKDVKEVVTIAVALGWKMHVTSNNAVSIVSYDERKRHHFAVGGRSTHNWNRIHRDVLKFAEPEKLLLADSLAGIKMPKNMLGGKEAARFASDLAAVMLPLVGDEGTFVDHRPEIAAAEAEEEQRKIAARQRREQREREAEQARQEARERASRIAQEAAQAARQAAAEEEQRTSFEEDHRAALVTKEEETPERHIVSEKPMVAKGGHNRAYESYTAIERLWSDGSKDWKCPECPYTSTKSRGSVPAHWSKVHSKGQGTREHPAMYEAEVPDARVYAPRQNRVDALAETIREMMKAGEKDPEVIARTALTWVHENSKHATPLAAEREELTPEDTLNRIRTLLDQGVYDQQQKRIDALEEHVLTAEAEAQQARQEAQQARETLRAFTELATEFAAGHTEAS